MFLFSTSSGDWVLRTALSDVNMVKVQINDSAYISFDAFQEMRFKSIVSEIAKVSDPYTGTYEVEVRLLDINSNFVSGLIGKAEIIPSVKNEYKVLPLHNIHDADNAVGYVYVAKGNRFEKRKIDIVHISDSLVYISSGISINDTIISEGADFLEATMEIEIIE